MAKQVFFRRKKSCPFTGEDALKIDYKDVKLLSRYISEKGKIIIKHLQEYQDIPMWKARDIAEGLFIAPRGVSGAMRKLVDDGFVEKVGQDPVVYALTEKGKNIIIED